MTEATGIRSTDQISLLPKDSPSQRIVLAKNQTSKRWFIVALTVGLLIMASASSLAIMGALPSHDLPSWMTSAIGTIRNTPQLWNFLLAGGFLTGFILASFAAYKISPCSQKKFSSEVPAPSLEKGKKPSIQPEVEEVKKIMTAPVALPKTKRDCTETILQSATVKLAGLLQAQGREISDLALLKLMISIEIDEAILDESQNINLELTSAINIISNSLQERFGVGCVFILRLNVKSEKITKDPLYPIFQSVYERCRKITSVLIYSNNETSPDREINDSMNSRNREVLEKASGSTKWNYKQAVQEFDGVVRGIQASASVSSQQADGMTGTLTTLDSFPFLSICPQDTK